MKANQLDTNDLKFLAQFSAAPKVTLNLQLSLPPAEWVGLHRYAAKNGWTLVEAVVEILKSSQETINLD